MLCGFIANLMLTNGSFSMDSPNVSGARCLGKGSIFDRRGNLVATVIQEGLARPYKLD